MNANEPAFPWEQTPGNQHNLGLTKRELFAKDFACALLNANQLEQYHGRGGEEYLKAWNGDEQVFDAWLAKRGIEMADALLAELEKKP